MEQNKICPLLTTNTVVDENNTVKIGTQPVFCVTEQCSCGWRTNRNVQSQLWEVKNNGILHE